MILNYCMFECYDTDTYPNSWNTAGYNGVNQLTPVVGNVDYDVGQNGG